MATKQYKTNKRYMCPYCDTKFLRTDLIEHVETKHPEMIPEGYTAARVIYEVVNKKNYGTCMICKDKVYDWDEKLSKYKNLCNKPSCREAVRQTSVNNMMRVYNKPHLLDEPEQQEKMLARRKISGTYKFSTDGTVVPYTGQYEKKLLEFFDKALNVDGKDIQSPGPVFEYDYGGKKHFWITDLYYIPANLVIEVKDGGDNPNNRPMKSYREKQVAKEEMITDKGTFNYLRLTNNNFLQLFEILADIKYDIVEPDRGVKISINENTPVGTGAMGGVPPAGPSSVYVIPTMMNNAFSGEDDENSENIGIYTLFDDIAVLEHCNTLKMIKVDDLPLPDQLIYEFSGSDDPTNFKNVIIDALKSGKEVDSNFILSTLLNRKVLDPDEIIFSDKFKRIDPIYTDGYVKNTIKLSNDDLSGKPVFIDTEDIDDSYGVSHNPDGYFVHEKIKDDDGITICSSYYEVRPSDDTIKNYIIPKIKVVEKQIRFTKKQLGGEQENAE